MRPGAGDVKPMKAPRVGRQLVSPKGRDSYYSAILRVTSRYLKAAGLDVGDTVVIDAKPGEITIRPAPPSDD